MMRQLSRIAAAPGRTDAKTDSQQERRSPDTPGTGNHERALRAGQSRLGGGDPGAPDQPAQRFIGARHAREARTEGPPETPAGRPPLYLLGHHLARRRQAVGLAAVPADILRWIAAPDDDGARQGRVVE